MEISNPEELALMPLEATLSVEHQHQVNVDREKTHKGRDTLGAVRNVDLQRN